MAMTPIQLVHSEVIGHTGTIIGISFAWIMLLFSKMWYFSIVMFFAIFLSGVALIQAKQKYKAMFLIQQQIEQAQNAEIEKIRKTEEEKNV